MSKFYKLLFFNSLIMGSIMTMSSYTWMMMWLGMEINLLSFIPLIVNFKSYYSSEAALKYFIVQALASTMLIFSFILIDNSSIMTNNIFKYSSYIFLYSSLMMKLGMSPFHSWLPEVAEGLNWSSCLILFTWQKIAPMIILMMTLKNFIFIIIVMIISSLTGSILGLNQVSMRKILAYSSINHMSWMLLSMINSLTIWMIYFSIYTITNFNLIIFFSKFKISKITQIHTLNLSKFSKLIILMNFLSLGGLPPMIGFLPKWFVISWAISQSMMTISVILILSTLVSIYFYMRILFPMLMLKFPENKMKILMKTNSYYLFLLNIIFLLSLTIPSIFF